MAYAPIIGGSLGVSFPLQFPQSKITSASLAVTPIEQLANDGSNKIISHATGFFWRHNGEIYLVTARHVLSGRDPFEDAVMSDQGYIPELIRVFPCIQVGPDGWNRISVDIGLTSSDGEPAWHQDNLFFDLKTDIAALFVPCPPNIVVRCLNDSTDVFVDMISMVGFECVILGYPTSNVTGLRTPLWRRGTFASEPALPIDNKPMFLLDALTSPGFSGGPVFRRHLGPMPVHGPDGTIEMRLDNVMATSFVGVYAGRLQNKSFGGEVPFVFYANRLPFILP